MGAWAFFTNEAAAIILQRLGRGASPCSALLRHRQAKVNLVSPGGEGERTDLYPLLPMRETAGTEREGGETGGRQGGQRRPAGPGSAAVCPGGRSLVHRQ